jgi:hypothetical protein
MLFSNILINKGKINILMVLLKVLTLYKLNFTLALTLKYSLVIHINKPPNSSPRKQRGDIKSHFLLQTKIAIQFPNAVFILPDTQISESVF